MKLHIMSHCPFCIKVLLVAKILDIKLDIQEYKFEDLKKNAYLKINPLGLVPSLEVDGKIINDSKAISHFLINISKNEDLKNKFQGVDVFSQSEIIQWTAYSESQGIIQIIKDYYHKLSTLEQLEEKLKVLITKLKMFDERLHTRTYLVSDNLTMADISLFILLTGIYFFLFEEKDRNELKNLTRWFKHISSSNYYTSTYGEFKFCEKRKLKE